MYTCIYVWICACMHVWLCMTMCDYVYEYMCRVCVFVFVCVCMYMCMYACVKCKYRGGCICVYFCFFFFLHSLEFISPICIYDMWMAELLYLLFLLFSGCFANSNLDTEMNSLKLINSVTASQTHKKRTEAPHRDPPCPPEALLMGDGLMS